MQELKKKEMEALDAVFAELGIPGQADELKDDTEKKKKKVKKPKGEDGEADATGASLVGTLAV